MYVSIIDAEDFATWRKYRAPLCQDLVVFDGADGEEFVPIKSEMMNETAPTKRSDMDSALAAESRALRDMNESSRKPAQVVLASRFTAATLNQAVANGEFGPSYTTSAKPCRDEYAHADRGAEHFDTLVKKFSH